MTVPWENTATVWPGWARAMSITAPYTRSPAWAKLSPPGAWKSGDAVLNCFIRTPSRRRMPPQGMSSQSPRLISRRAGRVCSSRPWVS